MLSERLLRPQAHTLSVRERGVELNDHDAPRAVAAVAETSVPTAEMAEPSSAPGADSTAVASGGGEPASGPFNPACHRVSGDVASGAKRS